MSTPVLQKNYPFFVKPAQSPSLARRLCHSPGFEGAAEGSWVCTSTASVPMVSISCHGMVRFSSLPSRPNRRGRPSGGVELVGVLNADNLLNNPDFRSAERAFQLLMQVAGRAGRRENPGTVVIQTAEPGHPVLQQVIAGDYEAMARQQLAERKAFFYPPYARLLNLLLRHRDPVTLRRAANALAAALRERFGRRVLGPTAPPVDRVRGEYLATLLLKVEAGASLARAREAVRGILDRVVKSPECKGVTILCDVDPQ